MNSGHLRSITPNPVFNLVPFGHWTLRGKAAQSRLALGRRYAS